MRYIPILLALLSGILLIFIFPTVIWGYHCPNLGLLAWIALVPLLAAIKYRNPMGAFGLGFLAGLVGYLGILYWISILASFVGLFILASYLALYLAVFCLLVAFTRRHLRFAGWYLLYVPSYWVLLEYLRSVFSFGFPWTLLGHSQYLNTSLIQIAEFTGVYGVSFLIVLLGAAVVRLIEDLRSQGVSGKKVLPLIIVIVTLGACFTYGKLVLRTSQLRSQSSEIKIGIVQGNIDLKEKWDQNLHEKLLDTHIRLSEEMAPEAPEVIVWSETATASCLRHTSGDLVRISELAKKLQDWLLIGSLEPAGQDKYYNSAFLISPQGNIEVQYNKIHLVPFGEVIPLEKQLPLLAKLIRGKGGGGFKPGRKLTLFDVGEEKFGVLICYEGIFDDLSRKFVNRGADFLVNITNDAWYRRTSAPYQHFSFYVFRAIENRVPIVRAANTGVSAFIDSYGRIKKYLDIFTTGTLVDELGLKKKETFYTRFGNLFAHFCLGISGLFLLWVVVKRM
jgi:apolipoprotein N-acyltransferase